MCVGDEAEVRGDGDDAVGKDDAMVTVQCDIWAWRACLSHRITCNSELSGLH